MKEVPQPVKAVKDSIEGDDTVVSKAEELNPDLKDM